MATLNIGDFASHCFIENWAEIVVAVNSMERRLRETEGRFDAAKLLLRAFKRFEDSLHLLAREMAVWGTERLRAWEKHTRVRPDTQGGGGPRLEDSLVCEVLVPNIIPGTIGISNNSLLDQNVPWWITNEIGSTARVGGVIWGLFYTHAWNDGEPPDPDYSGQHPLFTPAPAQVGGGRGVIGRPIPRREFVKKADLEIRAEWVKRVEIIYRAYIDDLAVVAATMR